MSKKIIFLFILFFSLFFSKLDQEILTKEEIDYSGIIFSNIEEIEFKKDFSYFLLHDSLEKDFSSQVIPFLVSTDKESLETFLDGLSCEDNILLAQFEFGDEEFFNISNINESNLPLYGVYYFSSKCGREKYVFEKNNLYFKNKGDSISEQVLFVGDMMFDRGVELLMNNNGSNYPFEKINKYLTVKTLVGNLEGPIVSNPIFISSHSMSFSFDKKVAQVLKDNDFSILSLANNHTSNMGDEGLKETKEYLRSEGMDYIGDPATCSYEDIVQKDNIVYYAVNVTFPFNCSNEEIVSNVLKIKEEHEKEFLVVLMHWGNEYEHVASDYQTELAHLIIDAGADLIIGGHPHVIQNVEKYKNKLIFYSLGNFIFDQYFSEETQQGLMIGLELSDGKQVYNIFTIKETKAQPELTKDSLDWLANISSESIREEIVDGKIVIY